MISISTLILTRLKIITLYLAFNFVKQEATYVWRTLTVFPFEPTRSLNNAVVLAGYIQVWSNLNMKSAVRVLTSKTSKKLYPLTEYRYFHTIMTLIFYLRVNQLKRRDTISLIKSRSRQERSFQLPFEKSCLLFFAHEKGLGHMFQKQFCCFPILFYCVATSQK